MCIWNGQLIISRGCAAPWGCVEKFLCRAVIAMVHFLAGLCERTVVSFQVAHDSVFNYSQENSVFEIMLEKASQR